MEKQLWVCLGRRKASDGQLYQFWAVLNPEGELTEEEVPLKKPLAKGTTPGDVYQVILASNGTRIYEKGPRAPKLMRRWHKPADIEVWTRASLASEADIKAAKMLDGLPSVDLEVLVTSLAPVKQVYKTLDERGKTLVKVLVLEYLER